MARLKVWIKVRTMMTKTLSVLNQAVLVLLLVSGQVLAAGVEIRQDSPSSYTVVRGDTLWEIAGKFLEEPWLWPQVWQVNPQIENPDLIYPGDTIELAYENGIPVLRLNRAAAPELATVRLSPEVRREALLSPIPAIALDQISSYLSKNSVLAAEEFDTAPYLVAEAEGRVLISKGDEAFARGNWAAGVNTYEIVRKGREFADPDTGNPIGVEALIVGAARVTSINGDRAVLTIGESFQEIKTGDRLIPSQNLALESRYLPAPPPFAVDAAIVSIGTGNSIGGQFDSLVINRGSAHGMEPGQLLVVKEPAKSVSDQQAGTTVLGKLQEALGANSGDQLEFPGEKVATVLVYRVFAGTSLALILESTNVVRLNDRVVTP
jgi:hypothetical protein